MMNSLFDRWGRYLVTVVALTVPLLMHTGMNDSFDLPKLTLVYVTACLLLILWFVQALHQESLSFRYSRLTWVIAAFLLMSALSAIGSIDRSLSIFGTYKIYVFGGLPILSFALLHILSAQLPSDVQWPIRRAIIAAAVLVSIYAILQYTGNELFDGIPKSPGGRIWSSLGNPLFMGAVCMMSAVMLFAEIFNRPAKISTAWPPTMIFVLLVGVMGLSLSRSAWLGLLAGCVWIAWIHRGQLKSRWLLGGFIFLTLLLLGSVPAVRQRVQVLLSTGEGSNAARVVGWQAGLKVWQKHPWLGTGPDTFFQAFRPYRDLRYIRAAGPSVTQAHAHNDVIQLGATQGSFAVAIYIGALVLLWRYRPTSQDTVAQQGFFAALLALAVHNLFNFSAVATCAWAAIAAACLPLPVTTVTIKLVHPFKRWALRVAVLLVALGIACAFIPVRADLAYTRGNALANRGDFQRALVEFEVATRLHGRVELYQTELGNTLRSLGRTTASESWRQKYFDRAWDLANDAVVRHPHNPDAWNNRGVVAMWLIQLAGRSQWPDARESFARATTLDPVFVDAWANLAKMEHLAGELDQEKATWRKVIELDPAHPMARQVLGLP